MEEQLISCEEYLAWCKAGKPHADIKRRVIPPEEGGPLYGEYYAQIQRLFDDAPKDENGISYLTVTIEKPDA